jgi:hypothetical protein
MDQTQEASMNNNFDHHKYLRVITEEDAKITTITDEGYNASWKQRGGAGAFFMLARKWDRIEATVKAKGYDVFMAIAQDTGPEGVLDDIRDLRRYLLLVEAEVRQYVFARCLTPRDEAALKKFDDERTWVAQKNGTVLALSRVEGVVSKGDAVVKGGEITGENSFHNESSWSPSPLHEHDPNDFKSTAQEAINLPLKERRKEERRKNQSAFLTHPDYRIGPERRYWKGRRHGVNRRHGVSNRRVSASSPHCFPELNRRGGGYGCRSSQPRRKEDRN